MAWEIVVEPEGKNPGSTEVSDGRGANEGGMVIFLAQPGQHRNRQEVARVAFERANSRNPDTEFHEQLEAEVHKARTAVRLLNETLTGDGMLV
jgi:hypothetical protein